MNEEVEMIPAQVPYAMAVVIKALKEDQSEVSLYGGFKLNIGYCFIDEYMKAFRDRKDAPTFEEVRQVTSDACDKFLHMLCNPPERNPIIKK
jgi:cytochrome c1